MFKVIMKPPANIVIKGLSLKGVNWAGVKKEISERIAFSIERFSKQVTPVDTGRLRSSIRVTSPLGAKTIRTDVGPSVKYAGWIHSGRMMRFGRLITIRGGGKAGTPPGGLPFMKIGTRLAVAHLKGAGISKRLPKEVRRNLAGLKREFG